MSTEEQHVALPRLYGAPAYARPPTVAPPKPKPFDPDDLPIAADQTDEERDLLRSLPAIAYAPGGGLVMAHAGDRGNGGNGGELHGRPFHLRGLAGRLFGGNS